MLDKAFLKLVIGESFVVAGTGSRQFVHTKEVMEQIEARLSDLKSHKDVLVCSGGAEGFDYGMARAAYHQDIPYILMLPSPGYIEYYWSAKGSVSGQDVTSYAQPMLDNAKQIFYVCDDPGGITGKWGSANFQRNQILVDIADKFFVYDKESRGTADCFRRLTKAGLSYVEFPEAFETF